MPEETNAWGIASLILAILSLILLFAPYFGLPLAIIAVVFSSKQKKIKSTGGATAGLVIGIIGIIFNIIMLLFVIGILAFLGIVGTELDENIIVQSTEESKKQTETSSKIKSATLSIDKIQTLAASTQPTRVTVINTGDVTINPKFDIYIYDSNGNEVCSGSPLIDEFSRISSKNKETGEFTFMCMMSKDGTYSMKVDLLDSNYNKLDSKTKDFTVNYWG